jgi:hypothetical protein
MTCGHCRAKRPSLHAFAESAWEEGTFEVVRCLLCGWQTSRLKPWKRRPLPEADALLLGEPDELEQLEARLLNFASKSSSVFGPYRSPFFLNGRN